MSKKKEQEIQNRIWQMKDMSKLGIQGVVFSILLFLTTIIPVVVYAVVQTQTGGLFGDFYTKYNSLFDLIIAILNISNEWGLTLMMIVIASIILFVISLGAFIYSRYQLSDIKDHLKDEEWRDMKRKKKPTPHYNSFEEWLNS